MIKNIPEYCKRLAAHLIVMLILFELCRVFFFTFNRHHFSAVSNKTFLYYMLTGLRFDISAIFIANAPFIFMSIIPYGTQQGVYRRYIVKFVYMLINSFMLCCQLTDTLFFNFVFKRSTADIFKFLSLGDDSKDMAPFVLKEYWYVLVTLIGLIILISYIYNRIDKRPLKEVEDSHHYISSAISSYIITLSIFTLGLRGGWQQRPIGVIDAASYAPAMDVPLVLNTPFSILNTFGAPPVKEYHFFPDDKVSKIYSPVHQGSDKPVRKLNIVNIIIESFSKEYIGSLNKLHRPTSTPFFDSLSNESLVFDNAYSDGKKSIEGIPSVVAGLPSWMEEAYITSIYNKDQPTGLPELLSKVGYHSAFFHGGKNGTMGFTNFCKEVGFSYYYGLTEYPVKSDFDGHWGVWDEPYFQYFAKTLDTIHQPFYAAIFSISSHHPFELPDKYKETFKQKGDELPILKCVRYTDLALREFFKTASKMPWFDSTLFVITADHAGPSAEPYYSNRLGMYEIPIVFYMHNSNLKGKTGMVAQHVDIMPSLLDYIHYPYPYFAFGNSLFDTNKTHHYAVSYINDCYQLVQDSYCMQIEGKNPTGFFNYEADSMLNHNLISEKMHKKDSMASLLEAIMQTYSNDLIHNNLKLKKEGS